MFMRSVTLLLLLGVAGTSAAAQAPTFLGPTPYLCTSDSPFDQSGLGVTFFLETFEDGLFNVPGVSANVGAPIGGFGSLVDSVDCDNGPIDGWGGGDTYSFFHLGGSLGIRFTFDSAALGSLPTRVGLVWTDGVGTTTFQAFDANGVSLGTIGPVAIADPSVNGTTAEDRFFGVIHAAGIHSVLISNTEGGIEIDHLQYGLNSAPAGTSFCFGVAGSACPCANFGLPGRGCENSLATGGALLSATGTPSVANDTLVLAGSFMSNSSVLYFQGTTRQNGGLGSVFGDGLRCAGGTTVRLGTKTNSAGASHFPSAGDPLVSVRGGVAAGNVRTYQVWYRNSAAFCTPSGFNLSNGLEIAWQP
jgi:hypothetical protein